MLYIKACNDHQGNIILGGADAYDGDYYGEDNDNNNYGGGDDDNDYDYDQDYECWVYLANTMQIKVSSAVTYDFNQLICIWQDFS